jgi:L-fucose mutarotase
LLKNIDPLLSGELLKLLDEMGHGELLALVDRNFPAFRYGKPVVRLDGSDTEAAATAILSVFPIDSFVESPVERMQIDGRAEEVTEAVATLGRIATAAEGRDITPVGVGRQEFYALAGEASAFVLTGETIPYSCFLIRKGVV